MITEQKFEDLHAAVEKLDNFTEGYYPTVKTLKLYNAEDNLEKYLPFLLYLSLDPYADNEEISQREDYREMVKYVKKLLYNLDIEYETETQES